MRAETAICWICRKPHEVAYFGPLPILSCPDIPPDVEFLFMARPVKPPADAKETKP